MPSLDDSFSTGRVLRFINQNLHVEYKAQTSQEVSFKKYSGSVWNKNLSKWQKSKTRKFYKG